jgi:hypothetical protein
MPIRSSLKSDAAGRIQDHTRFAAFVVCRRYRSINLRTVRKLGSAQGGEHIDGTDRAFAGRSGQVAAVAAELPRQGLNRERYLDVKIPPTNSTSSRTTSKTHARSQADSPSGSL